MEDETTEPPSQSVPEAADHSRGEAASNDFRTVAPSRPVEVDYADGILGFQIYRGLIKLDLYRTVGQDSQSRQEMREPSHRLVLPLSAVSELRELLIRLENAARQARERASQEQGQP